MNKNIVEYKTGGIRNMKELEELFSLLEEGTSPYQVVSHTEDYLKKAGFFGLSFGEPWDLTLGEKYYVNHHGSTIFAFTIAGAGRADGGYPHSGGAHTTSRVSGSNRIPM